MVHKRTKIIATIGPATFGHEKLRALAEAGMNIVRLNFSHGTHEEKAEQIALTRQIAHELGKPLGIIADLSGPKLRLGSCDEQVNIKKGDHLSLALNPVTNQELPIQFDLSPFVKKNQHIFINDGLVQLKVLGLTGNSIKCVAENDGWASSNKGVNVPDTHLKGAAFTQKDREDAEFALKQGVDYLNLSFIQTADDIKPARKLIKKYQAHTKIIVKIEKKEAVNNLSEIIDSADAVMVARGDLGIEVPASSVPIIQQKIIHLGRQNQTPVIVATQMLESMTENPRPTRAETSDVANAVLDQVDAVMLSAESAAGKYPIEAVKTMKEIILDVEAHPDYNNYIKLNWEGFDKEDLSPNAIVAAAASLAYRLQAKAIIIPTASGKIARLLSSFRPSAQIVAVTHDEEVMDQLALVWGVRSVIEPPTGNFDQFLKKALHEVASHNFAGPGDKVVIVTGSLVGLSGSTDTIKVATI